MNPAPHHSNVVVVGVDFSEPSRHALFEAVRVTGESGARLVVAHFLYDEEMAHAKRWKGISESDIIAGRTAHLEKWLTESGVPRQEIEIRVGIGHPYAELSRAVSSENAKLLVLGAQGENHKNHGDVVGSVAKSCLRHPSTDVLLVRKEHHEPFRNVLAAIDFSKDSKHAVHRAAEIAKSDDSDLHVVHVFAPVWEYYNHRTEDMDAAVEEHMSELRKRFCDFAYSELQEVKKLPIHFDVRESFSAYHGILEYAKEVDADLVVVGQLGRGRQEMITPGRTAERVIEKSNCSVLTVYDETP